MIFLLHGKKILKEFSNEIQCFIQEIQHNNFTILSTESFYDHLKKLIPEYNNKIDLEVFTIF